jgi:hypothetical protein
MIRNSSMHKVLLRLSLYEAVERLVRLESRVAAFRMEMPPESVLIQGFERHLEALRQSLQASKGLLSPLFSDNAQSPEKSSLAPIVELMQRLYQETCALSRHLAGLHRTELNGEATLFLKDAAPLSMLSQYTDRTIRVTAEGDDASEAWPFDSVLPEKISLLQIQNPLQWVSLLEGYVSALQQQHEPTWADLGCMGKSSDPMDGHFCRSLLHHCLSLRLLGPAYYFHSVLEALLRQDFDFLLGVEPLLFHATNFFNLTDKTLVILHEAVEKTQAVFPVPEGAPALKPQSLDCFNQMLKAVELAVPPKNAFADKAFQNALQLQERLAAEVLLSASAPYPTEEVRDAVMLKLLQGKTNACNGKSAAPIYEVLGMTAETPHTPREMINAAWVNKMERASAWLYDALMGDGFQSSDGEDGLTRLRSRLERQDLLLLKSIETAEVHRVLLGAPKA